jgi:hypothetical protein
MPKGSTIQTRRHADNNTTHTNEAIRLVLHQLPGRCIGFIEEEKIRPEENTLLDGCFSQAEIKEVFFSSYAHGVSGPDGLSFMFYQCLWETLKYDLINLFEDW